MPFSRNGNPMEDIKRGMEMVRKRRELIEASSEEPIVYDSGVNRLARSLHSGIMKASVLEKELIAPDHMKITLVSKREDGRFPYFRAGQYVTLASVINGSYLSRPYSIVSSPKQALEGILQVIVQKKGFFSKHLIEDLSVGDEIDVLEPHGDFVFDDLRDGKKILCIAGGSGVTPFLSMMKAIQEKSEDFRMVLLYGVRTKKQLLLDPKDYDDEKIRIEVILSDEECEGYRHGLIDEDLLKQYSDCDSVFMCGPDAMYEYVEEKLKNLNLNRMKVRRERNSIGDRAVDRIVKYRLTVHIRDAVYEIDAYNNETILTAIERSNIRMIARCRNGVCGYCHSRLIRGKYYLDPENDFRRAADKKFGYIHLCCTYPESDMEIDVPVSEAK
ncbi:MAG: 2Fe-2S iron-sulfur cluster binding domain-containing protein [Erysipelotrichaceae bacterium]|nr:2Fe-2S iron-sulfur cluster binding domain-containing protein [Erysipelotrichaceae bacterium]